MCAYVTVKLGSAIFARLTRSRHALPAVQNGKIQQAGG